MEIAEKKTENFSSGSSYDEAGTLRRLREQIDWNEIQYKDLSARIGKNPIYISRVLNGHHRLSAETLMRICNVIGGDPGYILTGESNKKDGTDIFEEILSLDSKTLEIVRQMVSRIS